MKKRIFAAVLALTLALSLSPAAFALGAFADVTDAATAQDVEVLRLMGVIGGDNNGAFRPNDNLTRAEFCKMAIELLGKGDQVVRFRTRTVFPDVRATHWASGYVNYAVSYPEGEGTAKLIHGMPDGTFQPDRSITFGEAVTILVRLLGYTDQDSGGVWPQGYIDLASASGVSGGVRLSGDAAITRAQAARMFVSLLTSDVKGGAQEFAATLGTLSDETTLRSIDLASGKLKTAAKDYEMVTPRASTVLIGLKGRVLLKDGKAITFIPTASTTGTAISDAAVIVSANGSTAGFDALTGGAANYTIYRNGIRATAAALKKNDVAIYNAAANAVLVTDTRVAVYYENCTPSQAAPTSIEALGGTTFGVVPTAQQSLAQFKPGQTMVLLLAADGRVAGAVANTAGASSNALAYVGDTVQLICGGTLKKLELDGVIADKSKALGKVARVSQNTKSTVYLSAQSVTADAVDLTTMKLGTRTIAEGAVVIDNGTVTSLNALGVTRVEKERVAYYRTNSANEVDLIVIADETDVYYGRAIVRTEYDEDTHEVTDRYIRVDGNGHDTKEIRSGNDVRTGDYVAAQVNSAGTIFTSFSSLTELSSVPASAWIGDAAVNYGGQTYTVPTSVICYNRNAGAWFDDLAAAKAYGGTMDLYVKDGVVRVVEVRT